MATHHVKSWSHLFEHILWGRKAYDLRKNDRNYKVGDTLVLQEYDNIAGRYTGNSCERKVSYITSHVTPCAVSSAVLPNDYCILGFEK